jgi:phage-related holin
MIHGQQNIKFTYSFVRVRNLVLDFESGILKQKTATQMSVKKIFWSSTKIINLTWWFKWAAEQILILFGQRDQYS